MTRTLHPLDRFVRAALGTALLELGYFWVTGGLQVTAYLVGALGCCGAGVDRKATSTITLLVLGSVLLIELFGGVYASQFFTRKFFLEDFNAVNEHYKQTLFLTGKNERTAAIGNYERLLPAYQQFQQKYQSYRPHALRNDKQFSGDLETVAGLLSGVNDQVHTGDLHEAHLTLEKVRTTFQDMFKRNGFSMLAIALVDFHDAMETMLDAAAAQDTSALLKLYPGVSEKLKAIEAEAGDVDIQTIRAALDQLQALAQSNSKEQLKGAADRLKSSFVKVYLQRG